jgi:hypothetical protein
MVLEAVAVPNVPFPVRLDKVTVKASLPSKLVSPFTRSVIVFSISTPVNSTMPLRSPEKSSALLVSRPRVQRTVLSPSGSIRVTLKVKSVKPSWPSALET